MLRRLSRLFVTSLVLVALLAGCGGDDSNDSSSTTESSDPQSGGDTDGGEGTDGGGDVDAFCTAYAGLGSLIEELPDETIEDVKDGAAQIVDGAQDLADAAPEEIADDAQIQLEAFEALKDVVDDSDSIEEAEEAASGIVDGDEASAAGERVQTYADTNC